MGNNDEEGEEGSGEEEEEEEEEEGDEEEIEEGDDESNLDEETPGQNPNDEDEAEDGDPDDDGTSQEGVPLDDNYADNTVVIDHGTDTIPNAITNKPSMPSQNISSATSPREFVPVAKPVPPTKGSVTPPPKKSPIITPKGKMHHSSRVIASKGVAKPYVAGTVNGIPVPAVANPVIPSAKVPLHPNVARSVNGIPLPAVSNPVIPSAKAAIVPYPISPYSPYHAVFRREPPIIPPSPPLM